MELYPAEVERLKRLVEEWVLHDERELEATFTSKVAKESTTFLAVAERLESKGFRALPIEDYMNIITPEQVRFTITGLGSIEAYCREDTLAGIPFQAMIKDRAGVESNLDIKEYDVRVKVRREIPLSATDPSVGGLLTRWDGQRKAFRIMRRWKYLDEANGVQFDLSMVRSTPTDAKGQYRWQTSFKQRDITRSMPSYEMEVELLRPAALGPKATAEEVAAVQAKAIKDLIRGIGEILRGINKHSILIRKSQATKVLEGYKELTKTDRFRGVAPITMLVENMRKKVTKGAPNVRTGYNVTDKADGLRMMGYVDKAGELFMIDMSLNVYRTGLMKGTCEGILVDGEFVTKDRDGHPIQQFLLFDCYHAIGGDDVTKLPFCAQPTGTEEQRREGSRYGHLMAFVDRWNDRDGPQIIPTAGVTQRNKIMVAAKNFIFAAAGDGIFSACARVLDSAKLYHTDGLILTPNEKAIPDKAGVKFAEQLKWKPSDENTVDFLVLFDKDLETKQDAVYTGVKGGEGGGATVQYKTLHLYVGSDTDPAYNDPRGTVLFQQPLPGAAQPQGKGRRRLYRPVLFNPTTIPDTMANTCYIELDEGGKVTGEDIVRCESGDPIEDRNIVEMRYNPKAEEGWRWIPMRIRYDKTERYQRGEKTGEIGRTLNKDEAAEGVWESIHDPVTLHMIRTGSEQPSAAELVELGGAVAAFAAGDVKKVYYERKAPKNDLMMVRGLRDFHRLYIKEKLLIGTGLQQPGKTLVDLACGQGGDLFSWVRYGADFVYGTDIAGNGIRDPHDGAYRRYLNAVMKNGGYDNVPKMIFTIGSSAKVLATGEAGATSEESNIMRSVYGQVAPDGPIPRFVEVNGAGRLREGADCVAIMFALHYFFENEMSLKNFMRNVSDSLKLGGLFIGCCFDGQKVFDELRRVPEGGTLKGEEKETEIWRITKKYSNEDFTKGPESLGLPIDVKFISIGTEQTEYLMNFEILKAEMDTIGCELLTPEECRGLGLTNSTELFGDTFAAAARKGEKFQMSPVVRQYSFFNRWFIFKRRRGGALPQEEEAVAAAEASPFAPGGAAAAERRPTPPAAAALAEEGEAPAAALRPAAAAAAVPGKKKYALTELLQFYVDASLADKLKLGDPEAARWIAPSGHFPIKDGKDSYPSLEHYMAAMKYKRASNKPNLASELFSDKGDIHQEFLRREQTLSAGGSRALTPDQKQDLIKGERKMVLEASEPAAFTKYRATFDRGAWEAVKDEVLEAGLRQRWETDERLRKIVEAAKAKGLYLLYYTGPGTASELGGKRAGDGTLDGENKVGTILMRLAGYRSI